MESCNSADRILCDRLFAQIGYGHSCFVAPIAYMMHFLITKLWTIDLIFSDIYPAEEMLASCQGQQAGRRRDENDVLLFQTMQGGRRNHGCQMAIAGFLDPMCLAHRASGLWLRYATLQN